MNLLSRYPQLGHTQDHLQTPPQAGHPQDYHTLLQALTGYYAHTYGSAVPVESCHPVTLRMMLESVTLFFL